MSEDKSSRVPPFDPDTCKDFKSWLVAFFLVLKRSFRAPSDPAVRDQFESHLTRAITIFHRKFVDNRDITAAQVVTQITTEFATIDARGNGPGIPVLAQNSYGLTVTRINNELYEFCVAACLHYCSQLNSSAEVGNGIDYLYRMRNMCCPVGEGAEHAAQMRLDAIKFEGTPDRKSVRAHLTTFHLACEDVRAASHNARMGISRKIYLLAKSLPSSWTTLIDKLERWMNDPTNIDWPKVEAAVLVFPESLVATAMFQEHAKMAKAMSATSHLVAMAARKSSSYRIPDPTGAGTMNRPCRWCKDAGVDAWHMDFNCTRPEAVENYKNHPRKERKSLSSGPPKAYTAAQAMYSCVQDDEEQYMLPYEENTEPQQYEFANPAFHVDSLCTPFVAVVHDGYGVVYDSEAQVVSHLKDFPHASTQSFNTKQAAEDMIRDQLLSTVTNWDHVSSLIAHEFVELNQPTYLVDSGCSMSPSQDAPLTTKYEAKNKDIVDENKILGDLQKNKKFTENEIFEKNKKALQDYDEKVIAKYRSTLDEKKAKDPQAEDVNANPSFTFSSVIIFFLVMSLLYLQVPSLQGRLLGALLASVILRINIDSMFTKLKLFLRRQQPDFRAMSPWNFVTAVLLIACALSVGCDGQSITDHYQGSTTYEFAMIAAAPNCTATTKRLGVPLVTTFMVDSGCSTTICRDRSALSAIMANSTGVITGDNVVTHAEGAGLLSGLVDSNRGAIPLNIQCLLMPSFGVNLLSVSALTKQGCGVYFPPHGKRAFIELPTGQRIYFREENKVFYLDIVHRTDDNPSAVTVAMSASSTMTWHERLRHLNWNSMRHLVKAKLLPGLSPDGFVPTFCDDCASGKLQIAKFTSHSTSKSLVPLGRVSSDIAGPFFKSTAKSCYYQVFVDECSGMRWIYTSSNKTGETVMQNTQQFVADVGLPRCLRLDNDATFTSHAFRGYARENGIRLEFCQTCRHDCKPKALTKNGAA